MSCVPPNLLRRLTWTAWFVVFAAAVWMDRAPDWSHTMNKRSDLGFQTNGRSPLLALQLASQRQDLIELLGEAGQWQSPDQKQDCIAVRSQVQRDFLFIFGYVSLFILMGARHDACWWMSGVALTIGLADVLENWLLLTAVKETGVGLYNHTLLWWANVLKWMSTFAFAVWLGVMELLRRRNVRLTVVLRTLFGLLMITGGVVGLCWAFAQNALVIENGFGFLIAALLLVPFWLWNPDTPWGGDEQAHADSGHAVHAAARS
jgi:hypothetical protein